MAIKRYREGKLLAFGSHVLFSWDAKIIEKVRAEYLRRGRKLHRKSVHKNIS